MKKKTGKSVAEIVTETILKRMQEGTFSWKRAWSLKDMPRSYTTGKAYRGINPWLLQAASRKSPFWLTYDNAIQRGASLKEGEGMNYRIIIFMKPIMEKRTQLETGIEKDVMVRRIMRYYRVYNQDSFDNLVQKEPQAFTMNQKIDSAEKLYLSMGDKAPKIERGDPAYIPIFDVIHMPEITEFEQAEHYYDAKFHETVHWTGAKHRLARQGILVHGGFGSGTYSKEELVAEMGSAFMSGLYGFQDKVLDNQVAYLQSWVKKLQEDPDLIISAASQAQKAVDFILDAAGTSWDEVLGETAQEPAAAAPEGAVA